MKPVSRRIFGLLLVCLVLATCARNELEPEKPPAWDNAVFEHYYNACTNTIGYKSDLQPLDVRFVCECTLENLERQRNYGVLEAAARNPQHPEREAVTDMLREQSERCYQRYLR